MSVNGNKSGDLSFEQANAICRGFVPAAEPMLVYIETLRGSGFEAFWPSWEFRSSFCNCEEEIELLKNVDLERAKLCLAHPTPFPLAAEQQEQLFASPLIQRLSEERDKANGVPLAALTQRYPGEIWRMEIEPCGRRKALASINDHASYALRREEAGEEARRCLVREAQVHRSGLSDHFALHEAGRFDFYSVVMQREAKPLGFEFDPELSLQDYPVFSKAVNKDWVLSWSLEEKRQFLWEPSRGMCELFLTLRRRSIGRGRLDKARVGQLLHIRFQYIIVGFKGAYWSFENLDELEAIVKAHLLLYSLMSSALWASLEQHLISRE